MQALRSNLAEDSNFAFEVSAVPQIRVGPGRKIRSIPDMTLVTLTYNSERHIEDCIRFSLEDAANAGLSCEFYVIDNGSKDRTCKILSDLKKDFPELRIVSFGSNFGTTLPRNIALRPAMGRYVCLLDSDAYPTPGCLGHLVNILETNDSVGIVVPRIVFKDGRYQKSTDEFPTLIKKLSRAFFLRKMEAREIPPPAGPVDYAISAFWLMRREVLEKVGLLDERIFYSPEDVDYCLRVWKGSFSVWYEAGAIAVHDAQERSRSIFPNMLTLSHLKGLFYLFWKHRYFFRSPVFNGYPMNRSI